MWNRSKSFRSKIMNYNLMLIVVMVLVCTTYVLINDRTIKKFNSTYTTYNELNQFYDNLKNLNDALQVYLYSPDDQNYKDFHRYRTVLQGNVEKGKGESEKSGSCLAFRAAKQYGGWLYGAGRAGHRFRSSAGKGVQCEVSGAAV